MIYPIPYPSRHIMISETRVANIFAATHPIAFYDAVKHAVS